MKIFVVALFLLLSPDLFSFEKKKSNADVAGINVTGQKAESPAVDLITSSISGKKLEAPKKTKILASIIKQALETYHYSRLKINDSISKDAYQQFLKQMDYGKQFFLKEDIKKLDVYSEKMDDQIMIGKLELMELAHKLIEKRIGQVENLRQEFFSKRFNFKKKEMLEVDPKKRDYMKTDDELKEHWRKVFKHAVLVRFLSSIDEQNDDGKSSKNKKAKNKKKKKSTDKKLSIKELRDKAYKAISKKYKRFLSRFLKEDYFDHLEKYFNAVASVFDPHTVYMPPKRKEDFDIDISGSLEGIGAVLSEDGAFIKVVKIVPGGAAWRQKELEVDDLILAVAQGSGEPVDMEDMRVDDAVRYIRGKKETEVRLTVKKVDGARKVIRIVRDVIQIGASFAKSSILSHKKLKKRFGYITVPKFYRDFGNGNNDRNCSKDVRKELKRLMHGKVDGIILDLRNNGGGALEDARIMSGLFIKEGPIVQIKNYSGKVEVLKDTDKSIVYGGPLIVMINRYSASASEILAGALQDYGRAIIVGGEYSHGKGTVQAVLNLNPGPLLGLFGPVMGALKVTIQKFYRISGASTQFRGVTPDIILPDPFGYTKNREKDLDFSLKWDEVKKLPFVRWKNNKNDISLLKSKSISRVKKNSRIQKIIKSVNYLSKRRQDTKVSLNIDEVKKQDAENKKMIKDLKLDEKNTDIVVSNYEASLRESIKIKKTDIKNWKKDFEQRKDEWIELIQEDPLLEETIYILEDMIKLKSKLKKA